MKLSISTHQGLMYSDTVDFFVIKNQDGEFGVLENHIPVISIIKKGHVRMCRENDSLVVVLVNAVLEFKNNVGNILAQEAQIGKTLEEATKTLEDIRNERIQENKKQQTDYTSLEKDLNENIKKSKAGSL